MLRATVRRGYPCQITFKGEPRFDAETDLWTVLYYGSGKECDPASAELQRQGKALRVAFYRTR